MISRNTIAKAVVSAIVGAATPCAARVFQGRQRPFLTKRGDEDTVFPAAAVYVPERKAEMGLGTIGVTVDKVMVELYVVDPPSPGGDADPDVVVDDLLDETIDAIEAAVLTNAPLRALLKQVPNVHILYGVDEPMAKRVSGATLVFECTSTRRVMPGLPADEVKRVVIETDFIGPHGTETDNGLGPDGKIEAETRIGDFE